MSAFVSFQHHVEETTLVKLLSSREGIDDILFSRLSKIEAAFISPSWATG